MFLLKAWCITMHTENCHLKLKPNFGPFLKNFFTECSTDVVTL